jgi:hypothetical protein
MHCNTKLILIRSKKNIFGKRYELAANRRELPGIRNFRYSKNNAFTSLGLHKAGSYWKYLKNIFDGWHKLHGNLLVLHDSWILRQSKNHNSNEAKLILILWASPQPGFIIFILFFICRWSGDQTAVRNAFTTSVLHKVGFLPERLNSIYGEWQKCMLTCRFYTIAGFSGNEKSENLQQFF